MSLFQRISNLTKATLHEVLNKVEDPVMMTGQYLRNLEEDIAKAENMVKEQKLTVQVAERKKKDAEAAANQSELNALKALEQGNEALAHQFAAAKIYHDEQATQFRTEAESARSAVIELELRLEEGKDEFKRLKEKQAELIERARKAKERAESIRPNFSHGIESGDAAKGFQRMEEKILGWEATADVSRFTTAPVNPSSAPIEDDLAISAEIERLKKKLN